MATGTLSAYMSHAQVALLQRLLLVAGYWNLFMGGETAVDVLTGSPLEAPRQTPAGTYIWRAYLGLLPEISQPVPTHVLKRRGSLSRLDRLCLLIAPSWVARLCSFNSEVISDVVLTYDRNMSDHCAVQLSLSHSFNRSLSPNVGPIIPDIICRSPRFLELTGELRDWCGLHKHDTVSPWRAHKSVVT